ncbi:class I SAM-dependent methyltransferase [Demequina oxidasica]|uniref:class I SAM-dependent methyltransferase n=1 Tax=Demequina oxidasica TaxID=676199 RepID=UPI000783B4C8|nr:class I SAM-dependent methyltransferase [Demequina oxidasica]
MSEELEKADAPKKVVDDDRRWNYSIHYQRRVVDLIPESARTAIDVGCGEGMFARELASRHLAVTAIDEDGPTLERALAQDTTGIDYLEGDFLTHDLTLEGYDVVSAIAVLHHVDIAVGLERLKALVAPGGVVLVVGASKGTMKTMPKEIGASFADKAQRLWRGWWDHGTPSAWPPPHTFDEVRDAAVEILPGCEIKNHLLYRYTLTWSKPEA